MLHCYNESWQCSSRPSREKEKKWDKEEKKRMDQEKKEQKEKEKKEQEIRKKFKVRFLFCNLGKDV